MRADDDDFATEQSRRLDAIGLSTEERIAEGENEPRVPTPRHRSPAFIDIQPPVHSVAKIVEYAEIDGYCDAAMDRPPSAAIRFVEARLHYNNMDSFGQYLAAYDRAYTKKRKAA